MLLTGREPPGSWRTELPDLASRFGALVSFSLWSPDDSLLRKLAQRLFDERQLAVPESTIDQMLRALERSPVAVREFIARADAKALAENRAITAALVRELLAELAPS